MRNRAVFCLLVLALRLQTSVLFMGFRAPWFSHHGSFLFEIWLAKTDPHLTSEELLFLSTKRLPCAQRRKFIHWMSLARAQEAVHHCADFQGGAGDKEPACRCRRRGRLGFCPWVGKIPWRRAWRPTPVFLPGESHGQSSLEDYSPWGHKGTWLK